MKIYRTVAGEELDLICFQHYGYSRGSTEAVLRVNYRLSECLPILPGGLDIILPDLIEPHAKPIVRLWN